MGHLHQRDLGGYYERILTVHYAAPSRREVRVGRNHWVLEWPGTTGFRGTFAQAISFIRLVGELERRVIDEGISIIKAHDPYLLGLAGWLVARATGRPFIVTLMSNYDLTYEATGHMAYPVLRWRTLEKTLARNILKRADLIMGGNGNNAMFGIRNGADPARTVVVRTIGVDERHFAEPSARQPLRDALGLEGRKVILVISRLSPEKYPSDILGAAAIVVSKRPEAVLLFVGDGPLRPLLEARARELGIDGHVRFLGFQDQERLARLLVTADVILVPLAGSALVEAALSGTPIIAYDVEWHRELIRHEETGILVPYRDVDGLAAATLRLFATPDLGKHLARNAREAAIAQHHPRAVFAAERHALQALVRRETIPGNMASLQATFT